MAWQFLLGRVWCSAIDRCAPGGSAANQRRRPRLLDVAVQPDFGRRSTLLYKTARQFDAGAQGETKNSFDEPSDGGNGAGTAVIRVVERVGIERGEIFLDRGVETVEHIVHARGFRDMLGRQSVGPAAITLDPLEKAFEIRPQLGRQLPWLGGVDPVPP
jgi:hypothetical protein